MMAPQRKYGHETYESPHRDNEHRRLAPVYRERMMERRRMVEQESRRARANTHAQARRGWAVCLLLAAGLIIMCGMRIYQSVMISRNAATIASLKDDVHELTIDAENYECRIAEASDENNIIEAAKQLGMTYPSEEQVRTISD